MPFNIGSEIQNTLSPYKRGHRQIKTSRQPQAHGVSQNCSGLYASEESSHQLPTPSSGWGSPQVQTCHSTNAKDRSWHFRAACNSSAQSSSHRFQYKKLNPQISTQSGWKHTACGLAAASSRCSAAEQPCRGLWPVSQTPAPHPGKQEAARATPAA